MKKCLEPILRLPTIISETDKSGNGYVTITFLKQLMQMVKEIGQEIILSPNNDDMEIYDNYRE